MKPAQQNPSEKQIYQMLLPNVTANQVLLNTHHMAAQLHLIWHAHCQTFSWDFFPGMAEALLMAWDQYWKIKTKSIHSNIQSIFTIPLKDFFAVI